MWGPGWSRSLDPTRSPTTLQCRLFRGQNRTPAVLAMPARQCQRRGVDWNSGPDPAVRLGPTRTQTSFLAVLPNSVQVGYSGDARHRKCLSAFGAKAGAQTIDWRITDHNRQRGTASFRHPRGELREQPRRHGIHHPSFTPHPAALVTSPSVSRPCRWMNSSPRCGGDGGVTQRDATAPCGSWSSRPVPRRRTVTAESH